MEKQTNKELLNTPIKIEITPEQFEYLKNYHQFTEKNVLELKKYYFKKLIEDIYKDEKDNNDIKSLLVDHLMIFYKKMITNSIEKHGNQGEEFYKVFFKKIETGYEIIFSISDEENICIEYMYEHIAIDDKEFEKKLNDLLKDINSGTYYRATYIYE